MYVLGCDHETINCSARDFNDQVVGVAPSCFIDFAGARESNSDSMMQGSHLRKMSLS